ncbi:MAG: glycosyltransferase family 2 protein [Ilumatobacteraceae bacterium]
MPVRPHGRLDIVIVNYETPALLDKCLRSVTDYTSDVIAQVVVVDNSATPTAAQQVVDRHPAVRLLRSTTNVGYGSAANRGIAATDGEYALVLNADAVLHAGAAEALIDELDLHRDTGVVGPRLVDAQDRVQPSCARFPTPGGVFVQETGLWKLVRSPKYGQSARPFFDLDAPGVVPWVLGAALAIRRGPFDAVGGFDPAYFMYYEEVDLCRRLVAKGVQTRFTPAATIGHIGGASTILNPAPMRREMFRSLARYTRRHGRDPWLLRLRLAVVAVAATRIARDLVSRIWRDGSRSNQPARAWLAIIADALTGWPDE